MNLVAREAYLPLDSTPYMCIATTSDWERARNLADEVRKRIFGYEIKDWVDHIDDVQAFQGYTHLVVVTAKAWAAYPDKELLMAYCQGYVDAR